MLRKQAEGVESFRRMLNKAYNTLSRRHWTGNKELQGAEGRREQGAGSREQGACSRETGQPAVVRMVAVAREDYLSTALGRVY